MDPISYPSTEKQYSKTTHWVRLKEKQLDVRLSPVFYRHNNLYSRRYVVWKEDYVLFLLM